MQRSPQNLELYKQTCKKVIERADNRCEVMIDDLKSACSNKEKHRCCAYLATEIITYTNFLHTATRNGKSDEWVLDPENIILGCQSHHFEEERTGIRVKRCSYDEISYIPEE